MGRFESPAQIVGLFVVAAFVSVGLIFLINAEQANRLQQAGLRAARHSQGTDEDPGPTVTAPPPAPTTPPKPHVPSFLTTLRNGVRRLLHLGQGSNEDGRDRRRVKRSSSRSHSDEDDAGPRYGDEFHKIRHAMKKLGGGGLDGDVVLRMILDSKPIPPRAPAHKGHSPSHPRWEPSPPHPAPVEVISRPVVTPESRIQVELEHEPGRETTTERAVVTYTYGVGGTSSPPLAAGGARNSSHGHGTPSNASTILMENLEICYKTDDVLVVIGLTCALNFAFVLVIWALVRWFSISHSKEKEFHTLDCEEGGESMVFPQDSEDVFWSTSGGNRRLKHRIRGGPGLTSASLYSFRPDYVPQQILKRSYSYSMEDLRYVQT